MQQSTLNAVDSAGTFTGWNFTSIWNIAVSINNGYPYLLNNSP